MFPLLPFLINTIPLKFQASRIFGIPYNSLLMYVRGKYGKSLKLDLLKKGLDLALEKAANAKKSKDKCNTTHPSSSSSTGTTQPLTSSGNNSSKHSNHHIGGSSNTSNGRPDSVQSKKQSNHHTNDDDDPRNSVSPTEIPFSHLNNNNNNNNNSIHHNKNNNNNHHHHHHHIGGKQSKSQSSRLSGKTNSSSSGGGNNNNNNHGERTPGSSPLGMANIGLNMPDNIAHHHEPIPPGFNPFSAASLFGDYSSPFPFSALSHILPPGNLVAADKMALKEDDK